MAGILNDYHTDNICFADEHRSPNTITMISNGDEMLKVSDKGFWVRGVKVEQDEHEARKVYEGFTAWLTWARLNGNF